MTMRPRQHRGAHGVGNGYHDPHPSLFRKSKPMIPRPIVISALVLCLAATGVRAEPTAVTVRAIARDAKFIGDAMGGIAITLTDAKTARRLASGLTAGGTGDTTRLIVSPRVRGQPLATPGAAAFTATLDLDRPTLVRAEAVGPMGRPDAKVTVTATQWVLPGKPLSGDGWVLEFPGLVVEPTWTARPGAAPKVTAKVTLMCGCPIEPGGHWDANRYEVRAALAGNGRPAASVPLAYAGTASTFSGVLPALPRGRYRLTVTAHDPDTGNTGVTEREVRVD
jgi:hypothetical protein